MHFETQWGFHRSFCSLFAGSCYGFWTSENETHFGFWVLGSQGQNSLRVPEFRGTKPTPGSGLSGIELTLGSGERNPLRVPSSGFRRTEPTPGFGERIPLWVPDSQERNPLRISDSREQNPPQVLGSRERNPLRFRVPKNGTHPGFRGQNQKLTLLYDNHFRVRHFYWNWVRKPPVFSISFQLSCLTATASH